MPTEAKKAHDVTLTDGTHAGLMEFFDKAIKAIYMQKVQKNSYPD
tara:strand:+ start:501 stop:635 length:135 start_codon:yes stop_codon:yes gene_type:complete